MRLVGVSMIRNDADIVEAFVRHTLRHHVPPAADEPAAAGMGTTVPRR